MSGDTSSPIVTESHGDSLVILFNKPERRSPLSQDVVDELIDLLSSPSTFERIRRIIFTGRDEVFASGADLREIASLNAETAPEFARKGQRLMGLIGNLPIRTVAAIDGYCFGGALDLAISCDERIASPASRFCHPGVGLGIITGWGGTQRLPRLLGESRAIEMLLTARVVDADEALRIGLIDEISGSPLARALEQSSFL
jgi:enoyl-CoA hydratase